MIVNLSEIDVDIAKALFLPLRVDAATNYLNRLIDVKKIKGWKATRLRNILQHLGQITRVRNDIVHLGLNSYDFKKGKILLTNKKWARNAGNLRRTKISMSKIKEINHDLMEIILDLIYLSGAGESKSLEKKDRGGG